MKKLVFISIFLFSTSAFADKPCNTHEKIGLCKVSAKNFGFPSTKIQKLIKMVKKVKKNMSSSLKNQILSELDNYFDFNFMAKAALQSKWKSLTSDRQQKYVKLFTQMLKRSYIKKLYKHKKFTIKITSEKLKGKRARVGIELKKKHSSSEVPVGITYKMIKNSSKGWTIYDVITDEVSLVKNYRSIFKRKMKSKGFGGLLSYLKSVK